MKNGYKHGKGIFMPNRNKEGKRCNLRTYTGKYKNDKLVELNSLILQNLGIREGKFKEENLNGLGIKISISGLINEGNFCENKLEGNGKIIYPNG
mmetsp:Transcript_10018/g.8824  ORF Transcript_10018/g.8824 Transcript_10018/m.8824 type:complete len:95 (-) Transcript_10018:17-301(-)